MKDKNHFIAKILLSCIFISISGCSLFRSKPDLTRTFIIGAQKSRPSHSISQHTSISISIGSFPSYLDHSEIITKIHENELKTNPLYRWATPLSEVVQDIVGDTLRNNFYNLEVRNYPQEYCQKCDYHICINIDELIANEFEDQVCLIGSWTLFDDHQQILSTHLFNEVEPILKEQFKFLEIVQANERILQRLSDSIVQAIDVALLQKEQIDL